MQGAGGGNSEIRSASVRHWSKLHPHELLFDVLSHPMSGHSERTRYPNAGAHRTDQWQGRLLLSGSSPDVVVPASVRTLGAGIEHAMDPINGVQNP